jgi:hypothetical protein
MDGAEMLVEVKVEVSGDLFVWYFSEGAVGSRSYKSLTVLSELLGN